MGVSAWRMEFGAYVGFVNFNGMSDWGMLSFEFFVERRIGGEVLLGVMLCLD